MVDNSLELASLVAGIIKLETLGQLGKDEMSMLFSPGQ